MNGDVSVKVEVSACLTCTNGVDVMINQKSVTFRQCGPKGGNGQAITIPLSDWEAVRAGVDQVQAAMERANLIMRESE